MTVVGPTGASPRNIAAVLRADAKEDDVSAASAAKFENALAQVPSSAVSTTGASPAGVEGLTAAFKSFSMDPRALTAADDAWVRFLAISEQLQNPQLSDARKGSLLKDLTENWRSFQSQSEPIARQVEDYIASQAAGPAGEPSV